MPALKAAFLSALVCLPLAAAGWLGVQASDAAKPQTGQVPVPAAPAPARPSAPVPQPPARQQPPGLTQQWYYTCGGFGARPGVHPLYDPKTGLQNVPLNAGIFAGPYPDADSAAKAYAQNCLGKVSGSYSP